MHKHGHTVAVEPDVCACCGELLCDCFDVSMRIKIYLDKKVLILVYSNPQLLYIGPLYLSFCYFFLQFALQGILYIICRCVSYNFSQSLHINERGRVRDTEDKLGVMLPMCYQLLYSKTFCILVTNLKSM